MSNYKISSRAYTKMILHAAKYPHCAINGILLSSSDDSNSRRDKTIEITDAIPLFHQCLNVSPMAEIALVQVTLEFTRIINNVYIVLVQIKEFFSFIWCFLYSQIEAMANDSGQQIAGYYAACELFCDNTIEKAPGIKIAEKIAENVSNACFIIVDNAMLNAKELGPALHAYQSVENRWNSTKYYLEQSEDTLDAVTSLLKRGVMKDLYDFDNHLDNLKNDWTNEHLNRNLEQLLAMY